MTHARSTQCSTRALYRLWPTATSSLSTVVLGLVLVAAAGCSDRVIRPSNAERAALRNVVTGAAAAAVGPDGRIQLFPAQGSSELTSSQATELASIWTRSYMPSMLGWIEKTHGAPVNPNTLVSCGRPLYARSPFEDLRDLSGPYRRAFGPWWLITFCDDAGVPAVSVAVSALAEITVRNGELMFPRVAGTEFVAVGVPLGHSGEYPMSPEAAVEIAARATGRRVASIPELITPLGLDGPPMFARWGLKLEGVSRLRTSAGVRDIDVILVGPGQVGRKGLVLSTAAQVQPVHFEFELVPDEGRARGRLVRVMRRSDSPVEVDRIAGRED